MVACGFALILRIFEQVDGLGLLGRAALLALVAAAVGACSAGLIGRNPLPDGRAQEQAQIDGMPGVRFWADLVPADPVRAFRRAVPDLPRLASKAGRIDGRPVVEILALSGGGGDGAFGAGLLAGWTKRGDRPQFEIVTGVSAGAIIAPFAFLGPKYDATLKEIWTTYGSKDIGTVQGLQGILGGDALVETSGLARLISKYLDDRVLDAIAREYARGRILLVLTTNLDAQRPVVWNLGALARSRHPRAKELFHKVILASAAIPGAFSPVRIAVTADGRTYDELHVDGGTTREVFVSPAKVPLRRFDGLYGRAPIRRIYVVKNGRAQAVYQPVEQKTLPIAGRAISTLILSQSTDEVYRIYRRARDGGADFNFTAIPPEFPYVANEIFDTAYQKKLFEFAEDMGRDGGHWLTQPPDIIPGRQGAAMAVKLKTVEPVGGRAALPGYDVDGSFGGVLSGQ